LRGQPGWVAALTPLSVDGMIVAASTALLADSRSQQRRDPAVGAGRGSVGDRRVRRRFRDGVTWLEAGEEASRVRTGHAPQNMASLRNLAIAALRADGWAGITSGIR
jgi:hypothetical protein